jgi:hypothetical protein
MDWGVALASYASEIPLRADTGEERLFVSAINAALSSRGANYMYHEENLILNPQTFALEKKSIKD